MINDRYKIIRKAGQGRSSVYLCEDILRPGLQAAIKILSAAAEVEERKSFRDEYFLLKRLNHPNIISVFDYGCVVSLDPDDSEYRIDKDSPFFTLEYFAGCELTEFNDLKQEPVLIDVICQVSSVLYYLHQSAYIYYDLKSENILIKEKDGKPVIKFIDFGLTSSLKDAGNITAKGTAEYIAPEILRREKIDHRVDLYSFGILLYKIVYGKFPFRHNDQLNIYKAHLDEEFDFPDSSYSIGLLNLIQNLLSKEADKRFDTSIGIMNEIAPASIKNYKNEWTRIPVFSGRKDSFSIISTYIEKENSGEVLSIKGAEGAGKSTLLQELNYKFSSSVLISADQNSGYNIWQHLLRGILYQQNIYAGIDTGTLAEAKRILNGKSINLVDDLKAVIIKLISAGRFSLLIDDFNLLSNFDLEIFLQLIPVLQVSKIKIVLTEESSNIYHSTVLNNLQVINLNPFTEIQVNEFVQNSFADFYPKDEISKAVMLYSDVLPGSIEIFLKDLIVLDIFHFTALGPVLKIDKSLDTILKGSQEDIYRFRFNNLDADSRDLAIFLSLFNVNPDIETISKLTDESVWKLNGSLIKLSEANILHYSPVFGTVQFTSQGIKEYICSTIGDLSAAHLKVAGLISEKTPYFNTNELARHWELAGKYEQTYETLKEELKKARDISALSYEKNVLEHLCTLPLKSDSLRAVKMNLSDCLFQVGELNASISLIDELLKEPRNSEEELTLKILKGKALIYLQSLEEGKDLLESILNKIENAERRNEILAEIAEAEYEMGKYEDAERLADRLIADQLTTGETRGKIY
ncbi:MAG TPA: serine/threonine-protein kinase, partial [Ignavibacteriaceae bacterium]|nr:serine/threonine-protein kinase [Ignavibacteriaceae bacterium]